MQVSVHESIALESPNSKISLNSWKLNSQGIMSSDSLPQLAEEAPLDFLSDVGFA